MDYRRVVIGDRATWKWVKLYKLRNDGLGADEATVIQYIQQFVVDWLRTQDAVVSADFWLTTLGLDRLIVILLDSKGDPWEGDSAAVPPVPPIPHLSQYAVQVGGFLSFDAKQLPVKIRPSSILKANQISGTAGPTAVSTVFSVESAVYSVIKTNPAQLLVNAVGLATSTGWTDGKLNARVYVEHPQDGIQDFDFVATPPGGIALDVLSPICGEGLIELETWMKGFRIHAASNQMEVLF